MKYLGFFSGEVYDNKSEASEAKECCHQMPDEQAADEDFVREIHLKDLMTCVTCFGCPRSRYK